MAACKCRQGAFYSADCNYGAISVLSTLESHSHSLQDAIGYTPGFADLTHSLELPQRIISSIRERRRYEDLALRFENLGKELILHALALVNLMEIVSAQCSLRICASSDQESSPLCCPAYTSSLHCIRHHVPSATA